MCTPAQAVSSQCTLYTSCWPYTVAQTIGDTITFPFEPLTYHWIEPKLKTANEYWIKMHISKVIFKTT